MKIKQEVEYQITAKAVLREDDLHLSVSIGAPYGQRLATETLDVFPEPIASRVRSALKAAIQHALEGDLVARASGRAHEARKIATTQGEPL